MAFGDGGNGLVGGSGFFPSIDELLTIGTVAVLVVQRDPGRGRLPVRGRVLRRLAGDRLGRDGRADEALGLLRLRRALHADLLARLALDLEPGRLAVQAAACRTSPARRSSTTRAPSPASPARLLLGPRIGKFGADGKPNAIPGHNMAYTTLGVIILWFGWFGFNPGSTLGGRLRRRRLLRVRRAEHEPRGGGRRPRRRRHLVDRDQEARPLDDAQRRDRGARRDHRGLRVRRAVGRDPDRLRLRRHRRRRRRSLVERIGIDDPVGAIAAHGMSGVWGTLVARLPDRAEPGRASSRPARAASSTAAASTSSAIQALGLAAVGAFTFTVSFLILFLFKVTFGIRTEPEVEETGPRRLRARHVGLPRVLHPGSGRLRHRDAQPPRRCRIGATRDGSDRRGLVGRGRGAQLDPPQVWWGGLAGSPRPPVAGRLSAAGDGGQQDDGRARRRPSSRALRSSRTSVPSMKTLRNCGSSSLSSKMRSRSGG